MFIRITWNEDKESSTNSKQDKKRYTGQNDTWAWSVQRLFSTMKKKISSRKKQLIWIVQKAVSWKAITREVEKTMVILFRTPFLYVTCVVFSQKKTCVVFQDSLSLDEVYYWRHSYSVWWLLGLKCAFGLIPTIHFISIWTR